jgi:hypothetical protein
LFQSLRPPYKEDSEFKKVPRDFLRFEKFEGSNQLPMEYNWYSSKDKNGNDDAIQLEWFTHRDRNPAQYAKTINELLHLMGSIFDSMKRFDKQW